MRLTKSLIESASHEDGSKWLNLPDDAVKGLSLRVYPSGRKAFVLRYRNADRRQRYLTLGDYGVLTLSQARDKARKHIAAVLDGADPQDARKRRLAAPTFAELCHEFMERHSRVHKRSWRDDQSRVDNHLVPSLGALKAASVTRADVAELHEKIGKRTPIEANRVLGLIRRIFVLAESWERIPAGHPNPATGITKFKERKRERWVTADELPRLAESIDAEESIYVRGVFWLYLLTGARKREILGARWADYDHDRKVLRIPENKSDRPHEIQLSAPAIEVIESLPVLDGNPFMFPGRNAGRPLVNIDKRWKAIRTRAGIEDVTMHDLRRTVGSWMAQSGNSLLVIQKALNHKSHASTLVYARMAQDPVRNAMEAHGERLMRVARGETAEVVAIDR